ncbi:hypothetical protein FZEAL_3123 [Fusarium zealandicum]|uniref:Uncharacterized protein n=1 Tax=Fusarium zealandicum TaxID=1053134 RepID=A0A8H4XMS5_9HYPO|nr:hypothetical protein FZEAL_3123 [Fusarium zealandicum]
MVYIATRIGHQSTIFKLGCTANCEGLCPVESQANLLTARYLWSCEDCHQRNFVKLEEERCKAYGKRIKAAKEEEGGLRVQQLAIMRAKEKREDKKCEAARVAQVEEIQWVAEWTLEYGLMVYDVGFKQTWSPELAAARVKELRDLRLWDFVVVRDLLRGPEELMRTQSHASYWIVHASLLRQRKKRHLARPPLSTRPPPPPPPPLFHDEEPKRDNSTDEELTEDSQMEDFQDEEETISSGDVNLSNMQSLAHSKAVAKLMAQVETKPRVRAETKMRVRAKTEA